MTETSPPGSCEGLSELHASKSRVLAALGDFVKWREGKSVARTVKEAYVAGHCAAQRRALAQSRPSPPGPDAEELREVGRLAVKALRAAAFEMDAAIPNLRNRKRAEWLAAGALANEAVATGLEAALRTSEEGAGRG